MTSGLTTHKMLPRTAKDRSVRWEVCFEGDRIGYLEQKKVGRSTLVFYEAFVIIDGKDVSLERSTDFEERCESVLKAWRAPESNLHVRSVLRLPDLTE
jgi:hypothetical protein